MTNCPLPIAWKAAEFINPAKHRSRIHGPSSQNDLEIIVRKPAPRTETSEARVEKPLHTKEESGELILEPGGDDLIEAVEKPKKDIKETLKKSMRHASDIVDVKEFTSDMKKVFTIETESKRRKKKIDELRKVLDYE